jgi:chromosome segregation ATPase
MRRLVIGALALFMVVGFLLVDSSAQKRKRKRRPARPQITNPEIYQPSTNDNTNSNTSSDNVNSNENANASNQSSRQANDQDPEAMKKTIHTLSTKVDKLTEKLSQMEESQRSLVDLERLSRAEQRSSQLHTELRDVEAKDSDLQARLEDIEYALKPENIERSTSGYGTTRPEELREQRRHQLESEKQRVQKQLDLLAASQTQLEQAIASTDAEIERLHKKLDAADQAAIENAKTNAQTEGSSQSAQPYSSPTPSPTPY